MVHIGDEEGALYAAHTIAITGASRGIGRILAHALAPGRILHLIARDRTALATVAQECTRGGATAIHTHSVDLADASSLETFAHSLATYPIDMLVNCAGIFGEEVLPWQGDPHAWWKTFEANVRAPYILAHYLTPRMIERGGGRILDLSSGAAVTDRADSSAYWASKTALLRLGVSLHEAGYVYGLRVLELAPGVVRTDMTRAMKMHEGRTSWTDPSEVAAIAQAFADGKLDGLSGCQVRAGTDGLDELIRRSQLGVSANARRLRLTGWE